MTMFTAEVKMNTGDVNVITTQNRGMTPEEVAKLAMDRIIYVSGDAPDGIKEQINTYKEKLFHVLVIYMTQAVQSDRTNVINLLEKEGNKTLAETIRRM